MAKEIMFGSGALVTDDSGNLKITLDSGQTLSIDGVYHSVPPTLANATKNPLELDAAGNLKNAEQFAPLAEDNTVGVIKVEQRFAYANIATQTTTVIYSGVGFLHSITFGKPLASGVVAIYDNTAGSGTLIGTVTHPATLLGNPYTVVFDVAFIAGLTVVTSGATQDITVSYRGATA